MSEHEARAPDAASIAQAVSTFYERHAYTDIYLPISTQQKKLFDAIDGKRAIAEIAQQVAQRDAARVLFEGLWWHEVAFDASTQPGRRPTGTTHIPMA